MWKQVLLFYPVLAFFKFLPSATQLACQTIGCDMQTIIDFPEVVTRSWQECQASCNLIPQCTHWAWRTDFWHNCPKNYGKKNGCYRKISTGNLVILPCQTDGLMCGPRKCGPCDAKWLKEHQGIRPENKRQKRILGGSKVNDWKRWPWIASLNIDIGGNKVKYCGGVLISCQHVVTALHCLVNKSTNYTYPPDIIKIFLATTNKLGNDGIKFTAADIFHLPDKNKKVEFYPGTKVPIPRDDIALIKLNRAINPDTKEDKDIRPIMLPTRALELNDNYWIAGWGKIAYNYATQHYTETDNLMETDKIPMKETTYCERKTFNAKSNICFKGTWKNAHCKGDSGSPGMIFEQSRWYLEGIVSRHFGGECHETTSKQVHMNVINYKKDIDKWIKNK